MNERKVVSEIKPRLLCYILMTSFYISKEIVAIHLRLSEIMLLVSIVIPTFDIIQRYNTFFILMNLGFYN